ncbi:hypothetical protein DAPPUDRAFT_313514 [Daphnia pulex]|uniref:Superoxide dismutase [Cu-Zn] n=1 Tax=Daphnia pulex TaxID=6669 RepID=E9G3C5_DAPPU|nr:hypothetical protein DAPPUDRAFT_313514 [Daphnia pulex]|eukprot:EFX86010.1 hypothetical protein DAPPUDRAFT_313514 [Daphnia pulex]
MQIASTPVIILAVLLIALIRLCNAETGRAHLAGNSPVKGVLNFTECSGELRIVGEITGLTPGQHGFHVHEFGDIFSNRCDSTGKHFNPTKALHGAPRDAPDLRHAGDYGNILADASGVAKVDMVDTMTALSGPNSIIGRAMVVHANEDDLGRQNNEGSRTTGNSGPRIACGIIFIAP